MTARKHTSEGKTMFENLTVEHGERRTSTPVVDVDPQVAAIVAQSWTAQVEERAKGSTREIGHMVRLSNKAEVNIFHEQARSAAKQHDPALKYRRLSRVGDDKVDFKAYFSLQLLAEYEKEVEVKKAAAESAKESLAPAKEQPVKEPAKETPAAKTPAPAKTPPAQPAHRTTK